MVVVAVKLNTYGYKQHQMVEGTKLQTLHMCIWSHCSRVHSLDHTLADKLNRPKLVVTHKTFHRMIHLLNWLMVDIYCLKINTCI